MKNIFSQELFFLQGLPSIEVRLIFMLPVVLYNITLKLLMFLLIYHDIN